MCTSSSSSGLALRAGLGALAFVFVLGARPAWADGAPQAAPPEQADQAEPASPTDPAKPAEPPAQGEPPASGTQPPQAGAGPAEAAAAKAPDLVAPPPELAGLLARVDAEAEPGRELKRVFVSVLHYLLTHDVDRLQPYLHVELFEVNEGRREALAPEKWCEALRASAKGTTPPADARSRLRRLLDLTTIRAYSRAAAREAEADPELRAQPRAVAEVMQDGDWLLRAPMKAVDGDVLPPEVSMVLRRHGERFKIVLFVE